MTKCDAVSVDNPTPITEASSATTAWWVMFSSDVPSYHARVAVNLSQTTTGLNLSAQPLGKNQTVLRWRLCDAPSSS